MCMLIIVAMFSKTSNHNKFLLLHAMVVKNDSRVWTTLFLPFFVEKI